MNNVRTGVKSTGASLSHECDPAPFSGSTDCQLSSWITGAGIERSLHTIAVCYFHDLIISLIRCKYIISQSHLLRQFNTVRIRLHADEHIGSQCFCQHQCCQTDRSQTGYQYCIIAADTYLFDSLIYGTETTGHLCSILVGQLIWQCDQILLICQNILCHATVSLPSVCLTEFTLAGNIVASSAIVTYTTSGNVINNNTVALLESLQIFAFLYDQTTRFMTCHSSGNIAFRTFSHMFSIDAADITAADSCSHCLDHNLSMSRLRHFEFSKFYCAVARKNCSHHLFLFHFLSVHLLTSLKIKCYMFFCHIFSLCGLL